MKKIKFISLLMVSIALLVACEKNAVIEKFNESIKQAPDARSHAQKILPVETIHQYDWAQQVPLFKNEQLVGVKVLHKNIVNNQLSYLIIHYNTGAFADVVLHEIQYEGKVGQSKPISIKSNNLSKNRIALLPLTAGSSNKDLDNGRNGTGKKSLVSPGGTLPMVTITGIYNNGSITAVTPTTYFLMNGAFVNGGGGSSGGTTGGEGGTNPFDPYIYLDYLDPLYVPDAGSSGLPSEFNLNEYDETNGVLFSILAYPGKEDGFPFRWWKDDTWLDDPTNFSLDSYDSYKELTFEEKVLVKKYPVQAIAIHKNRSIAFAITQNNFPNAFNLNDKADAFRHCFFNTINTISVGANLAELFGNAHESETKPNLILEKQMDLWNNGFGYLFGETFLTNQNGNSDYNYIAQYIINNALNDGSLRYLKPIWPPKFDRYGVLINPAGDPNFYGTNGTYNINTATHGITSKTTLYQTNQ